MTGTKNHQLPSGLEDLDETPGQHPLSDPDERLSHGLSHSLTLIVIGASIGVFWREVFQLTIRAIEAFR